MVGNRLRCDLGSRSSECKPKNDKPQDRNDAPSPKNNGVIDASDDTGSLPAYLVGGYGLECERSSRFWHWILDKSKAKMAYYYFNNEDKVAFTFNYTERTTDEFSWRDGKYKLNRQTLTLSVRNDGDFACKVIPAMEILGLAKRRLEEKLRKNKL